MQDVMHLNVRCIESTDIYYFDNKLWEALLIDNSELSTMNSKYQFMMMRKPNTTYPIDVYHFYPTIAEHQQTLYRENILKNLVFRIIVNMRRNKKRNRLAFFIK